MESSTTEMETPGRSPRAGQALTALALVAAGTAMALSLPPWGFWPLGPIGLGGVAHLLAGRSYRSRLLRVLLAQVVFFAITLSWVTDLHVAGFVGIVGIEALFVAVLVALAPSGPSRVVGFPAAVVLAEALRWSWPFGGVPLANLALGQVGGPLLEIARISTALGVVGTVAVLAAALAAAVERRSTAALALAGTAVVLVVVGLAAPRGHTTGHLDVAAVPGGGELGTRARDTDDRVVFDRHMAASETIETPVDLVLWPEDVVDVHGPLADAPEAVELGELAARLDAPLVVGTVESYPGSFRNAAVVVLPDGRLGDRYDKKNRVPFGEYVPFRSFLDRFVDLSVVPRDAQVGADPASLDTPAGRMAVVISFELFFPRRVRSGVRDGGVLILGPTNASSYPNTMVPEQTLASSRLRAVEHGRWLVQASPTGYAAVVDEEGRVHARTGLREAAVVQETVETREGDTWATSVGRLPAVWLAVLGLGGAWVHERRRTRPVTPPPAA